VASSVVQPSDCSGTDNARTSAGDVSNQFGHGRDEVPGGCRRLCSSSSVSLSICAWSSADNRRSSTQKLEQRTQAGIAIGPGETGMNMPSEDAQQSRVPG